jgi:FMN-dependent NADH-azoreductase
MSHTILHIDSSPLGDRSVSRKLTAQIMTGLKAKHPDSTIIRRDFGATPLPHLSSTMLEACFTPPEQRDSAQNAVLKPSDQATDEVLAADIIVIGAPMWNFGIPSSLKAWIDHIVRAGRTFRYTATGAEGLVPAGKKVIIASARGGVYADAPASALDHQESYLKAILGFMGITDVVFVRAEGVAMGEAAAQRALQAAEAQLVATLKNVA